MRTIQLEFSLCQVLGGGGGARPSLLCSFSTIFPFPAPALYLRGKVLLLQELGFQ